MAREKKIKVGAMETTEKDLCFRVVIRKEKLNCNKEYSKRIVGYIKGRPKLLNQCSDIYQLVENKDIFPNITQVLFNNAIDFKATYKQINDVRFYADYEITDDDFAFRIAGTNDVIHPMIRVQHSYNGLTKYGITFGYFRLVCTNGLTIPVAEMEEYNLSIKGKHTEVILKSLELLNDKLAYFIANRKEIKKKIGARYDKLASNVQTNVAGRIEEVLEAAKIIAVDNAKFNTVDDILKRIEDEANKENLGYKGVVNDWLIYNGINQYINDDNRNIQVPEKRMETDSKVLEYMLAN